MLTLGRTARLLALSLILVATVQPATAQITKALEETLSGEDGAGPETAAPSMDQADEGEEERIVTADRPLDLHGAYILEFEGRDFPSAFRRYRVGIARGHVREFTSNQPTEEGTWDLRAEPADALGIRMKRIIETGGASTLQVADSSVMEIDIARGYPFSERLKIDLRPLNAMLSRFEGQWQTEDAAGKVHMRRVPSSIAGMTVRSLQYNRASDWSGGRIGGEVPRVDFRGLSPVIGNRVGRESQFVARIYGRNLWGPVRVRILPDAKWTWSVRPIFAKGADARSYDTVVGVELKVDVPLGTPPGNGIIEVNGRQVPIVFDWEGEAPEAPGLTDLMAVTSNGQRLRTIPEDVDFRFAAIFDGPHPAPWMQLDIPQDSPTMSNILRPAKLFLRRVSDQVYQTRLIRIDHQTDHELEGEPKRKSLQGQFIEDYDRERSQELLKEALQGSWDIDHDPKGGAKAKGVARIASGDTPPMRVVVDSGAGARSYELRDMHLRPARDDPSKVLGDFLLSEIVRHKSESAKAAASRLNRKGKKLSISRSREQLLFTFLGKRREFPIEWLPLRPRRHVQLKLLPNGKGAYDGIWLETEPDMPGVEARQVWRRAARIDDAVPLDQLPEPAEPKEGAYKPGYGYPFKADGSSTGDRSSRLVLVTGQFPRGNETVLISDDPKISYELVPRSAAQLSDLRRRAQKIAGAGAASGADALLVQARLQPGVLEGMKTLRAGKSEAVWLLEFSRVMLLELKRPGSSADASENVFYPGESIRVSARVHGNRKSADGTLLPPGPLDGLEVELLKRSGEGAWTSLGRIPLTGDTLGAALSGPIHLSGTQDGVQYAPDPEPDALAVDVAEGAALAVRPLGFRALPAKAIAEIRTPPAAQSIWEKALARVRACHGNAGESGTKFAFRESSSIDREFLLGTRGLFAGRKVSTRVLNGDHAALLLIRDALISKVKAEVKRLRALSDAELLRLFRTAQARPALQQQPFWSENTVDTLIMPLSVFFDEPRLKAMGLHPGTRVAFNDLVIAAMREAYDADRAAAEFALKRLIAASDCDVEELLIIAGQRSRQIVDDLLPKLVRQVTHEGPPPRVAVEPDGTARRFVETVHAAAAEVRAFDEYASIDRVYRALAISGGLATVALPVAGLLTHAEMASAVTKLVGGTLMLADATETVLITPEELSEYAAREHDYKTMLGMEKFLDPDVVGEFEARRTGELSAAASLLPGMSMLVTAKHMHSALRIQKGMTLADDVADLRRLGDLGEEERLALGAAYIDALRRAASGGATEADEMILSNVGALLKRSGLTPIDPALLQPAVRTAGVAAQSADARYAVPETLLNRTAVDVDLAPGATIPASRLVDGERRTLRLGEALGKGGSAHVFADAADPDWVLRVVREEDAIFDNYGRARLMEMPVDTKFLWRTNGAGEVYHAVDAAGGAVQIERLRRVPNVAQSQLGDVIDEAGRRLPLGAQGSRMTEGQALALAGTIRSLNRMGYAWTDATAKNFRFVRQGDGDRWLVEIIDTGYILPARGASAAERYRNAVRAQRAWTAPQASASQTARDAAMAYQNALLIARHSGEGSAAHKAALARWDSLMNDLMEEGGQMLDLARFDNAMGGAPDLGTRRPVLQEMLALTPAAFDKLFEAQYARRLPARIPN